MAMQIKSINKENKTQKKITKISNDISRSINYSNETK